MYPKYMKQIQHEEEIHGEQWADERDRRKKMMHEIFYNTIWFALGALLTYLLMST